MVAWIPQVFRSIGVPPIQSITMQIGSAQTGKEGEVGMILSRDGMETKVWILPYEASSIDKNTFIQKAGEPILVKSVPVPGYEDSLVEICFPNGSSAVAKAEQIITAVQKCVL